MDSENHIVLLEYLHLFLKRKWWFLLTVLAGTAIGGAFGFLLPPVYRSSTLILVEPQRVPEIYVKPTVTTTTEDRLSTISQQIMSRTDLDKIITEFNLYKNEAGKLSREEIIESMRKDIDIKVIGKDAFTLTYSGNDPKTVMGVTNNLASLFIEENLKFREQQAEGTSEFLANELIEAERDLKLQEGAYKNFKEKFMGELPQQLETNLRTLDRLQVEQQTLAELLKSAEERKSVLEVQMKDLPGKKNSPEKLEAKLEDLNEKLADLRLKYKETFPDIIHLKKEIAEKEEALNSKQSSPSEGDRPGTPGSSKMELILQGIKSEIESIKERQKNNQAAIEKYEKRVEESPDSEQKMTTLTRDYETTRKNYQVLLEKRLNAKISENMEKRQKGEQFRILDPANLPEKPYKPNRLLFLLAGLCVGIGAGTGLIFLVDVLNPSFKRTEEVEQYFEIPALGAIPKFGLNKTDIHVRTLPRFPIFQRK